ncbi:helix-turn-helix domain-containing protein [Ramlibacter tataouinensis]|uniref:GlxA family transcriptional regulator n=1 Tax=Ramlibacter tataouinensis TaxID=94132 RepID=UPI0022F3BB72|nr:helix-turn-helix domain-containing protein [Ramlibacter tataouinensis]WBY02524.1 helix-turn-helix domain-containing protein [Ramlibacter tataouinensis]
MFDFTVIVLPGAYGSSVAATLDMLQAACGLAPRVGAPVPRWRVCSPEGGEVRLLSGLRLDTARLPLRARSDRSTWILPGLGLHTEGQLRQALQEPALQQLAAALAAHVRRGGRVAAGCSAVFLLHGAGLLEGRRATTSWWLAPLLQRLAPAGRIEADRMVCADGPVTTGGAAFAQADLMLHLLRERCGAVLADAVSRFLLVDARQAQASYRIPEVMANGDEFIARLVARVEGALPNPPDIATLAREFCVSQRTLARRVQRTTGKGPLALLQGVRLRRARTLLEQSRLSVEQVAAAVGYSDATALRRLMRKATGANPSRYRAPAASASG